MSNTIQRIKRHLAQLAPHVKERDTAKLLAAACEELTQATADKDQAYLERNYLVAALTKLYPSGIRPTNIEGWLPDWHGCVYVDLPGGQISYHYHDSQAWLFKDLSAYEKPWDGHDKNTVHYRLLGLTAAALRIFVARYRKSYGYGAYDDLRYVAVADNENVALGLALEAVPHSEADGWTFEEISTANRDTTWVYEN